MLEKTPIDEALGYDAIAEAEKLTGKSYKEDSAVAFLGLALTKIQREKTSAELFLNRDTDCFNQSWSEFCDVIEEIGFELVLSDPFSNPHNRNSEELRIYWMPGFLLRGTSYMGSPNDATMYFEFVPELKNYFVALNGCSHGPTDKFRNGGPPHFVCSYDSRQGLRNKLDQLKAAGHVPEIWEDDPFLWLLDYKQTKKVGYDYKAINAERISRLPEHVRRMIGNFVDDKV
jgi:hypothetical protein